MAMGKRKSERQEELWISAGEIAHGPGSPF